MTAPPDGHGNWLGYPKGAWLIVGVEFWERFSFYGMLALLALFLTGDTTRGAFGWPDAKALSLVGLYSGAMYALPAFGGYVADRFLGRRRAVALGAGLMLAGHVLMASPVFIPEILSSWRGAPLAEELRRLETPLGYLPRTDAVEAAIATRGSLLGGEGPRWLSQAYTGAALGFYAAIACLILGNALMKSTMVVLCGDTFAEGDSRREGAYAYYYLGIALGALLSGFAVGTVAEAFGWHYGFSVAAFGMAVALGAYLLLGPRWLGDIGVQPDRKDPGARETRIAELWTRLSLILLLALLLCVFSTGWFQMYGSWSLFIERSVDRSIGGFSIPVPWFASLNAGVVILAAPILAAFWVRLGERNQSVDIVQKYAFALGTVAVGHVLMFWGAAMAAEDGKAPVAIPLLAVAIIALGELVAWTSTYGIVYRAAPAGFISATMGAWYLLTLGVGGYLSGNTGSLVERLGYGGTFLALAAIMGVVAIGSLLARRPLIRLAGRAGVTL
ncbi:MAG TPA: peptide MFS transporter [Vicinamibacteria bacterium]